jgi:ribosomal protein L37AE/L43A
MPDAENVYEAWAVERGVMCVVCPRCAFTFAKDHMPDSDGLWTCPCCRESELSVKVEHLAGAAKLFISAIQRLPDAQVSPTVFALFTRDIAKAIEHMKEAGADA